MLADVAGTDGAQDCIGQGMEADVSVGMADQPLIVGHRDTAEHDLAAGTKAMNVETVTGPDIDGGRKQLLGTAQIGLGRHLEILLGSFNQRHCEARSLGHRRIVGQFPTGRRIMSRHYIAIAKRLGRLCPP